MNGREIPGFYFDPEKKKYFKIQEAHQLPHARYSKGSIKKERRKQEAEQETTTRAKKLQEERVVRRIDRHPLSSANINRETGSQNTRKLWSGACVSGFPCTSEPHVETRSRRIIRLFDLDVATGTVYSVHGDCQIYRRRRNEHWDQ